MSIDPADIAAIREQGDLKDYLLSLIGRAPAKPKPAKAKAEPAYHIPRKGAWPCGTAASGPTPPPCGNCPPPSPSPRPAHSHEDTP